MTSDALIAMIERKLKDYGLEKVVPDDDLLAKTYREFHRSQQLREEFEELESEFEGEQKSRSPKLERTSHAVLEEQPICAGMMQSRSCSTKRNWILCGREAKGQKEIR